MSNPFAGAQLLDCPPPDPLRKAAESLSLAAKLKPLQLGWARSHDWFDSVTPCGALIVIDRFTYKGRSYEERIIWGGTFFELADWAGY
jgi:hypothetical protein